MSGRSSEAVKRRCERSNTCCCCRKRGHYLHQCPTWKSLEPDPAPSSANLPFLPALMSTTEDIDTSETDPTPLFTSSSHRSSSSSGVVASSETAFDYDSLPPMVSMHWDPNLLEAVDNITNQPILPPTNQPNSTPTNTIYYQPYGTPVNSFNDLRPGVFWVPRPCSNCHGDHHVQKCKVRPCYFCKSESIFEIIIKIYAYFIK